MIHMKQIKFFTIGVYRSSEEEFFNKLTQNKIDTFCDIRRRRGVRGSEYSFVNSERLQSRLAVMGIKYIHVLVLAPTDSIRYAQKEDDIQKDVLQRKRETLSETFISRYKKEILAEFDFNNFFDQLKKEEAKNVVLFCVEANAAACHRSLVAEHIKTHFNNAIEHL
jgi:uncharacterized protein (DUF488 family)